MLERGAAVARVLQGFAWIDFDLDFELPRAIFPILEEKGRVTLGPVHRSDLLEIVRFHIVHYEVAKSALSARKVTNLLQKCQDAAANLRDAMAALHDRSRISEAALSHLQCAFNNDRRFFEITNGTSDLALACDDAIETINKTSPGRPGPTSLPHFAGFIGDLARVYRKAGGKPSATISPNCAEAGGRWTPFVRFAWTVFQSLPENVDRHTEKKAFANAVNAVVRPKRRRKANRG
jgi:hypothetical protein